MCDRQVRLLGCNSCSCCRRVATKNMVQHPEIKYVKNVSCVDHLGFVKNATNITIVGIDLLVGAILHEL